MYQVIPSQIKDWRVASKIRPIKAKPLVNLIFDRSVIDKFLINTIEGREPLYGNDVVICVGEAGDVWQQTPKTLLKKYRVSSIDKDGWLICEPLPDNAVDCVEVSEEMLRRLNDDHECGSFYIIGQWGETVGEEKNVQRGKSGDFICRNQSDPTDVWIVQRGLFLNTYVLRS